MHIAIEGMDGVGKTTTARLLSQRLGFRLVEKPLHALFDEPGEVTNYIRYRDYINRQVDNHHLRAWFYGLGNLLLVHRFASEDIITDRHLVSNYFWCGGPDTEQLFECLVAMVGNPDHTFLLVTTRDEARRRLKNRSEDDPDLAKADLHVAARSKMESFLKRYRMPYTRIDSTHLSPEQVVEAMLKAYPTCLQRQASRQVREGNHSQA